MKINKLIKELKKLEERHGDKKVTFVWHHEPTGATEYYHITVSYTHLRAHET